MTDDRSPEPKDALVHKALASPVRRRMVELVTEAPRDAHGLAEQLGLHVNTVRVHLNLLEQAALVGSSPEPRNRPGRPRLVYRATADAADAGGSGGYRFLAEVLASHLAATVEDPAAAAEQAGASWGRFLVDAPAPFAHVGPDDAIAQVVALLDRFGFAPELDGTEANTPRLLLRRCPFLQVAKEHQDVVCSIHLGIMRGALDGLGVDVQATQLVPFVERDLCVATLAVAVSDDVGRVVRDGLGLGHHRTPGGLSTS